MSLHVIKGTAAPTATPTEIGQHFLDTTNGQAYVSVDTNSSTDWKRIDNDGAGVTTFLGLTDSPVNYVGSAGKVATVNPGETALVFEEGQSPLAEMSLSTSNLIGCKITINADNTLFDMAAGTGIHVDNTTTPGTPVVTIVNVPERLGNTVTNIATQSSTSISIDGSGNIIQTADMNTASQRRDRFSVGVLIHTDLATIVDIAVAWSPGFDTHAQLNDLMESIGFFLTGGNDISGVSSTLNIQKAAGTGFARGINVDTSTKDPHTTTLPLQNPITFFNLKQDGVVFGVTDLLDPTTYDNAGVLTTVPSNNNATIKYLFLFATGAMSVLTGQEVFANFAAAVDASGSETVIFPDILGSGIFMARIIMQKTATDTTDSALVRIVPTAAVASGGGGGAVTTMQGSYDISVQPQITLDSGSGGIHYADASTPIGDFLFKVSDNADTTDFIKVDVGGVTGSELISDGLNPNTAIAGDASGKLISTATTTIELGYLAGTTSNVQTQINSKEPTVTGTTSADYYRGDKTFATLNKAAVGLGNVDNTSDANKPVSTAQQTEIDTKEDTITATTSADIYQGDKTFVPKLGLPISTATQSALDAKPDNFLELDDTPSVYDSSKFVTVNAAGDALEFSGGELWTPASLATEAEAWWDASDETTITESGSDVSQIDDKTSNARNLVQATGSRQPLTGNTLNSLNVLTFDHTTSELLEHLTFPIPTSRDISIFSVQSYTSAGGTLSDSLFSMDSSTSDWQTTSDSETQYDGRVNTTGMGGSGVQSWAGGPFNGPSIYNLYFNKTGNGRGAYVDGVEVTTEDVYTTGMDTPQHFRIMANRSGGGGDVSGILAEMVVVEDQSLATRQLIEGYLKWKWNLSALPVGHPYEFFAPTIAVGTGGGFTNLSDTPSTVVAGQFVKGNSGGTALEYELIKQPSTAALTPTTGAVALDWTAATVFTHAISGNSTFTISNQVAGESIGIVLTSSGIFTPTFTGVLWAGGIAPGAMASSDVWSVTLIYDGTNTLGVFQEGFA